MGVKSFDFDGCMNLGDFLEEIEIWNVRKNFIIDTLGRTPQQFFIDEFVDEFLKGNNTQRAFNASQREKNKGSYLQAKYSHTVTPVFKILEELKQAVDAGDEICIGSNRQSDGIDALLADGKARNQIRRFKFGVQGTAIEQFSRIIARLQQAKEARQAQQAQPGQEIGLPERDESFKRMVSKEAERLKATRLNACFDGSEPECRLGAPVDDTKFLLLLNQMHKSQQTTPCTFTFYDDRNDILRKAHRFFKDHPMLIPNGMTLEMKEFCPLYGVYGKPIGEPISGTGHCLGKKINNVITSVCSGNDQLLFSEPTEDEIFNPRGDSLTLFGEKITTNYYTQGYEKSLESLSEVQAQTVKNALEPLPDEQAQKVMQVLGSVSSEQEVAEFMQILGHADRKTQQRMLMHPKSTLARIQPANRVRRCLQILQSRAYRSVAKVGVVHRDELEKIQQKLKKLQQEKQDDQSAENDTSFTQPGLHTSAALKMK